MRSTAALAALAERAVKWSAATTVARFLLQFGAQVALARLLGPDNYGVYGIGLTVLTFVAFLSGGSFAWNLMLLPSVTADDVRFSFTWQVIVGAGCAVAMYAAAPALALFFSDQRVQSMVQMLSIASLLTAAAAPATCLLQRDLNFRALGLIQLASYGVGYLGVGVPMALQGYGPSALGAACVVQAAVVLLTSYAARPHPVRPLFSHAGGSAALATGRTVFVTNVVNWLLSNIDRVLIGRVLNAHAVGLYNVAYNLASIPNTLLLGALQPTFLATGAKLQDDRVRMARGWLIAMSCVLVLAIPSSIVFALLSGDLVRLLYGPAWSDSAWVLGLLFMCLPAWTCWGISTPVLWNTDRKHLEYMLQLPLLAVALPAWWIWAPSGIRAIAIVSALVIFARAVVIVLAALHALKLRWSDLLPAAGRGAGLACVCTAAVLAGQRLAAPITAPGAALFAGAIAALLVLAIVLRVLPQALGRETRSVLARFMPFLRADAPAAMPASAEGLPR
ncbi:MAG TPA: oligosaccharide flippase family protein [Ramlibacter sp.]|nr:oligosaccharide flippase family protein [Ramlibacter sp.]